MSSMSRAGLALAALILAVMMIVSEGCTTGAGGVSGGLQGFGGGTGGGTVGGSGGGGGGGSSNGTAVPAPYYIVANQANSTVAEFGIDTTKGTLTPVLFNGNTNTINTGLNQPGPLLATFVTGFKKEVLYVGNQGQGSIAFFVIDQVAGVLTPILVNNVNTVTDGLIAPVSAMTSIQATSFFYAANKTQNTIAFFNFQSTGNILANPSAGNNVTTGVTNLSAPVQLLGSSQVNKVYALNQGNNTIAVFDAGKTGVLTPFLFGQNNTNIINTGLATPTDMAFVPQSFFIVACNAANNSISEYLVDQLTGSISQVTANTVTNNGINNPSGIKVSGGNVVVSNKGNNTLVAFPINSTTGVMTTPGVVTDAQANLNNPIALDATVFPFIYALNQQGGVGSISGYTDLQGKFTDNLSVVAAGNSNAITTGIDIPTDNPNAITFVPKPQL